jgi:UDP-N-acetylglucosamine:LPS N-acetylglucosamine transferase
VPARVLGFVENMAKLMHTADLLITKSGPSTISEALCCGLPMLISGGLRGQEEGNAEWAAQTGAALLTPTCETVVAAVKDLLQDGNQRLLHMSSQARRAARPDAAANVARTLDDLLNQSPSPFSTPPDSSLESRTSPGALDCESHVFK